MAERDDRWVEQYVRALTAEINARLVRLYDRVSALERKLGVDTDKADGEDRG